MKQKHPQVERWAKDENFQKFLRQMHLDIHVGLKNGVAKKECRAAIGDFIKLIKESVPFLY